MFLTPGLLSVFLDLVVDAAVAAAAAAFSCLVDVLSARNVANK